MKENAIFVVSSLVFIGLFAFASESKKIPMISTSTPATIATSTSIDTAKIETKTAKISDPPPSSIINKQTQTPIQTQSSSQNREDDSQSEREDDQNRFVGM